MTAKSAFDAFYRELFREMKKREFTKEDFTKFKAHLAKKHATGKVPTDIDVRIRAPKSLRDRLGFMIHKPTRTISGVAVCSLMAKPFSCPHGKCTMCPGGPGSVFGDVPQSYTGREPATMRAIRNRFEAYFQIMSRLSQYAVSGHAFDKVEVIIQGGTFPAYPKTYQRNFVRDIFQALNDFGSIFVGKDGVRMKKLRDFFELDIDYKDDSRMKRIHKRLRTLQRERKTTLEEAHTKNEKSRVRCVGLTIETKPDWGLAKHGNSILELGCTRVEVGFQTDEDIVLKAINRGHTFKETVDSTRALKDLAFKINFHVMLGLPRTTKSGDRKMLSRIFTNPDLRPDMLKIYPCMVMPGTVLYNLWKRDRFKPIGTKDAVDIIADFLPEVPEWVRIMRVQRDIPTNASVAGVDRTNLRQYIDRKLGDAKCRDIRAREIGHKLRDGAKLPRSKPKLVVREYDASGGREFFISFEYPAIDALVGYCRLRFPSESLRPEITGNSALVRELHVMGTAIPIGEEGDIQHKGLGKQLMKKAESIARNHGKDKILVISGVGVREYYRKLGYRKSGSYMAKKL